MASVLLPQLSTAQEVDRTILAETDRLVIIRFGHPKHPLCLQQDVTLVKVAPLVQNFAAVYLCDIEQVPDFNDMYELHDDTCAVMFFWRNKEMQCDFGTGRNWKMDFLVEGKKEMVDVVEVIWRAARKGKGLVDAPINHAVKRKY